ncbi:outer membrane lipoprotein carrier protein LolA [Flavobacterium sp.]|uniref:outer membrane lipoprotein carrier protein LolA n=1 Tax=Flavobacterium sp. TaxID=239 RepID=UPI0025DC2AB0|nr:outer membrane lipoprotein carrier protein LolA [Flavobacterium sp.]
MKFKVYFVLLFISFWNVSLCAQEQKMSDTEMVTFKQSVSIVSRKIKSLASDFVQYKHLAFLSKDIETSGRMIFKEPNMILWEYKKPYNYSVIFMNGKILINDEGKKSAMNVSSSKVFGKINKLIVGSVSGDMFDDKEFLITYFKTKTNNIAKFIPKDASLKKYIKQIELTFDKDDATVIQIKLLESSDDFTRIVLKNKTLNAKIEASLFNN